MVNLKKTELLRDRCLIDGKWVAGSQNNIAVKNPATGRLSAPFLHWRREMLSRRS